VEQLDAHRFQFVRRMENVVSSQPLYEKIIVDRTNMTIQGFTYEKPSDIAYSEHYTYSMTTNGDTNYDMKLFRDPGLKRVLRN
jgi:hypothetical protein